MLGLWCRSAGARPASRRSTGRIRRSGELRRSTPLSSRAARHPLRHRQLATRMSEEQEGSRASSPPSSQVCSGRRRAAGPPVGGDHHRSTRHSGRPAGSRPRCPGQGGWLRPFPPADGGVGSQAERWLTERSRDRPAKRAIRGSSASTAAARRPPSRRLASRWPGRASGHDCPTAGTSGFLRDGARLLVVVVSDEDDCSEIDPTLRPSECRRRARGRTSARLHETQLTTVDD